VQKHVQIKTATMHRQTVVHFGQTFLLLCKIMCNK